MKKTSRAGARTGTHHKRKGRGDPISAVLLLQSLLSVLLLATAFCSRYISEDAFSRLQTRYAERMTVPLSEQVTSPTIARWEEAFAVAQQSVAHFWRSLLQDDTPQFVLGQGGFGAVALKAQTYEAPSGYLLSPVFATVAPALPADGVLSSAFG